MRTIIVAFNFELVILMITFKAGPWLPNSRCYFIQNGIVCIDTVEPSWTNMNGLTCKG